MRTVLLVESDAQERETLAKQIRQEIGCIVLEAEGAAEAQSTIGRQEVSLALIGRLPTDGEFHLLASIHASDPSIPVIVAVPAGDRERIVRVLKMGAFFYVNDPYLPQEVIITVARGLRCTKPEPRGAKIRKSDGFQGIIGRSPEMERLFGLLEQVSQDDLSTVLLLGESGTGKELVARAIHALSSRGSRNLVPVNCAAIPEDLLESELFGYIKGAFTGANQSKQGRIQYADGGTLFLDEIGDMKPALQAKLLRVLQEREFEPVGGVKAVPVDVRVIAATHRDLEKAVAAGTFREDLYYRLNVVPITIPPLRERKEDIPLLVEKFTLAFNREKKVPFLGFDREAMASLLHYPWPGNVRELENLIQRMSIFYAGKKAGVADLPAKYRVGAPVESTMAAADDEPLQGVIDFHLLVSDFEGQLIAQALKTANGNKKEAARLLSLKRTTLLEKIKKKGLQ